MHLRSLLDAASGGLWGRASDAIDSAASCGGRLMHQADALPRGMFVIICA